ncbi:MAG: hypothetical protein UR28_C0010G0056 [Candidatus Peregrinibacteria bacterium GW2011_GWF2_33_10]|nr:MAG: hypothetical protein UR28_C0010G0056 [Candidatus Peregrinibacteria bacterium GW2011_GWF2_33_10]OGJ46096.1 MAG: hypothetical protein A2272_05215 [Candidatus Peregrinibacteria bacterium RIFOXYA12_FULL_33_12]OGJ46199.1 MAG: hypothetical protein A2263_04910 [Candidatus Peregrinibacteria bacterium RIFOXYA2_FULL_33_21]OGJ51615.1 MAG: hypothetical protein A2307_04080 [Candidatus Peregrinibacteria bacterium RIFOXYB2_FULL_33_20]
MNTISGKSWRKGWYHSKKAPEETSFSKILRFGGIFLFLAVILLIVLLCFQFFAKVKQLENKFSETDIGQFEVVLNDFGRQVKGLSVDNDIVKKDNSLLKSVTVVQEEYNNILKQFNGLKYLSPKLLIVFGQKASITDFLIEMNDKISSMADSLNKINTIIEAHQLVFQQNQQFRYYENYFTEVVFIINKFEQHLPAILSLLGDRYPRHFLLLLQNSSEIRPTGGFIGGYVTFDLDEGYLQNLKYLDVYQSDGQLADVDPSMIPEEVSQVAGRQFGLRDANISPDFAVSAKNIFQLLEASKQDSADPIIAIDLTCAKELLALIGEVEIPDYNLKLNKDNFETILSFIVESKQSGAKNPKQIFEKLIPAFIDALKKSSVSFYDLSVLSSKLVREKHLQAYSSNEDIESFFDDYGLAGKISVDPNSDYLNVIEISVGGNKTDRWINESYTHSTLMNEDGDVFDELHIKRINTMDEEFFNEQKESLKSLGFDLDQYSDIKLADILFSGVNQDRFRVYVPLGSILQSASGLNLEKILTKIDQNLHLSYFAFEDKLAMDKSKEIILVYKLPFKLNLNGDEYRLKVVKQAGKDSLNFEKKFIFDDKVKAYKFYPDNFTKLEKSAYDLQALLNSELNIGVVVAE